MLDMHPYLEAASQLGDQTARALIRSVLEDRNRWVRRGVDGDDRTCPPAAVPYPAA
jgi:hypothetical protein